MNSEQIKALLDRLESATHEVIVLKAENKQQAAKIKRLKEHIEELKDKIRMLKAGFIPEEILDSRSAEIKRLKEENQRLKEALDYCCDALDVKFHCEELDKTCEGINSTLALWRDKCIKAAQPQKESE